MAAASTVLPAWLAALLLLAAAHSAPVLAARALGSRWAAPIDGGAILPDGESLFGAHKTWRGILASLLLCALLAGLLGQPVRLGLIFAALAMSADLLTSGVKRRVHTPVGREIPLLDQIPEALLPLLVLHAALGIGWQTVWLLCGAFLALDLMVLPLRHRRHPRWRGPT